MCIYWWIVYKDFGKFRRIVRRILGVLLCIWYFCDCCCINKSVFADWAWLSAIPWKIGSVCANVLNFQWDMCPILCSICMIRYGSVSILAYGTPVLCNILDCSYIYSSTYCVKLLEVLSTLWTVHVQWPPWGSSVCVRSLSRAGWSNARVLRASFCSFGVWICDTLLLLKLEDKLIF